MIRRTLLEWTSLSYGDGENQIPRLAADRLAAVARASPLAGRGGARVLAHGRHDITAGQVVGVIAAEGCALEILPKIDFTGPDGENPIGPIRRQLVHMLAVAFDMDIAAGAVTDLGWQKENLLEILIGLFARKLSDAVREGMPRRYAPCEEDLPVLRGRLDVVRQFTVLAASPQTLACRFDILTPDIALNQIMKTAIDVLARVSGSAENQRRLRELAFAYAGISSVGRPALRWDEVTLDRTNSRWRELVDLARLLLGDRFQTTSEGKGRGFSLLFEMHTLFEKFIARVLKRALARSEYSVHSQGGQLYCLKESDSGTERFRTKPDILIKSGPQVRMIVDTKWKRISGRIEDPKQGVSQADVYQMMAYGRVYGCPELMLLYPHHGGLSGQEGSANRLRIQGSQDHLVVATVDVSARHGLPERLRTLVCDQLQLAEVATPL